MCVWGEGGRRRFDIDHLTTIFGGKGEGGAPVWGGLAEARPVAGLSCTGPVAGVLDEGCSHLMPASSEHRGKEEEIYIYICIYRYIYICNDMNLYRCIYIYKSIYLHMYIY